MPRKPKYTIQPVERSSIKGVDKEVLAKTQDNGVYPLSMAKEIRLDRIRPDPDQPRRSMNPEGLEELAASIKQEGILQPIAVQYVDQGEDGYFMLTHGERRWRAAQMAGLERIPAIIREETDDTTKLVRQLMENIQREDLNAVDRAEALKGLKEHLDNPSWETVAERVGIKRSRLFQLLDVTKQPEAIQEDIRAGRLTEKHSRALQRAPEPFREELHQAIIDNELSAAEATAIAKQAVDSPPGWTIGYAIEELREKRKSRHDPLAALVRAEKALEKIDVERVEQDRLETLLRGIVGRATALLKELGLIEE